MRGKLALSLFYLVSVVLYLFVHIKPSFGIEFLFVAISTLAVYETGVWIAVPTRFRAARTFSKHRLQAMDSLQVTVRVTWEAKFKLPLPWLKFKEILPPTLQARRIVEDDIRFPWRLRQAEFSYRLNNLPRGYYHFSSLEVVMGDAFGLMTKTVQVLGADPLIVYPRALDIHFEEARGKTEGVLRPSGLPIDQGTQVMGTRPYRHGDHAQKIHWAATARTGFLVSKEYEPINHPQCYLLLYADEEGFGRDPSAFETALSLVVAHLERWQTRRLSCQFWSLGKKVHQFVVGSGKSNTRALDYLAMAGADAKLSDLFRQRERLAAIPAYSKVELVTHKGANAMINAFIKMGLMKKWDVKIWIATPESRENQAEMNSIVQWLQAAHVPVRFFGGQFR